MILVKLEFQGVFKKSVFQCLMFIGVSLKENVESNSPPPLKGPIRSKIKKNLEKLRNYYHKETRNLFFLCLNQTGIHRQKRNFLPPPLLLV